MPCPGERTGPSCATPCGHYAIICAYREERARQLLIADDLAGEAERAQYLRDNPAITFKQWLVGTRRRSE